MLAPILMLTACGPGKPVQQASPQGPVLVASIQEIMKSEVDPSADALWNSVSSTITAQGAQDAQPHTDEEWDQVRHYAVTLAEAPNLLVMEGRLVAPKNAKLDDAATPGILAPPEIQKKIDADHPTFARYAIGLQKAAREAIVAIDARNPDAVTAAGGEIDEACEACHKHYWYPNSPEPK
jgi:hypothetical protein